MKQMAKKKSKGKDGIPQDCLLLGAEVLSEPLAEIINASVKSGIFPEQWKEERGSQRNKKLQARQLPDSSE